MSFTSRVERRVAWPTLRFPLITTHRLFVIACLTAGIAALYTIQSVLWSHSSTPHGVLEDIWSWGALLWLAAIVPGVCGLIGLLAYRHPKLDDVGPIQNLVCWRIVSRGTNIEALRSTVKRCQDEMAKTPLFPYIIEVVTDTVLDPPPLSDSGEDVRSIVVPQEYETANRSLFKARGLQYALENSPLPDDAWLVHLDEETQPTPSGIQGIARMISHEERRERQTGSLPRIGQGAILYHRDWKKHPFLTLADNVRTGDDFARFHFEHRIGVTIFGLHGSYIVVRNDVEKVAGFDFGPVGSITEDAFWALVCMEAGLRCRWVDGYLEEQSTQSVGDFVRQRRRWFQGLAKVSLFAPVKLRWRICLGLNTTMWAIAPFAMLYTLAHFFYGFGVPPWLHFLANFSFASFATLYLVGLYANLKEHPIKRLDKRVFWAAMQVILLPIFSWMESVGVLMAIFKPVTGFHVVTK